MKESFAGMRIIVSPYIVPVPKIQLSHDFNACTDAGKAKMNKWLLDRFGTHKPAYFLPNNTVVVAPEHYAQLKKL